MFQKLFRQDLLLASLYRNFLLSERILYTEGCSPMSYPALPPTRTHAMWHAWDLAADAVLAQLPKLLDAGNNYQYVHTSFFADQLTAFEIWLDRQPQEARRPEQLPVVLQVLLSQTHRLRALELLYRFLELGSWAVSFALHVGVFPYVLRLLQSPAAELRPVLLRIWAKLLATDSSFQADLVRDKSVGHFVRILQMPGANSEQRALAAFVLAAVCNNYAGGQEACLNAAVLTNCLVQLEDPNPLLRRWCCLCLGKLWHNHDAAKWIALRDNAQQKVSALLTDPVPEVRAAAVYALGSYIGNANRTDQVINVELNVAATLLLAVSDGSPLVRKELVIALSSVVHFYESKFRHAAVLTIEEQPAGLVAGDKRRAAAMRTAPPGYNSVITNVWMMLLALSHDRHPEVAKRAMMIVDTIVERIVAPVGDAVSASGDAYRSASAAGRVHTSPHAVSERQVSAGSLAASSTVAPATAGGDGTGPVSMARSPRRALYTAAPDVSARSDAARGSARPEFTLPATTSSSSPAQWPDAPAAADRAAGGPGRSTEPTGSGTVGSSVGRAPHAGLPLESSLFEWSQEYFRESASAREETIEQMLALRAWRHRRLAQVRENASVEQLVAGNRSLDSEIRLLDCGPGVVPCIGLFHGILPQLIVADEQASIMYEARALYGMRARLSVVR